MKARIPTAQSYRKNTYGDGGAGGRLVYHFLIHHNKDTDSHWEDSYGTEGAKRNDPHGNGVANCQESKGHT